MELTNLLYLRLRRLNRKFGKGLKFLLLSSFLILLSVFNFYLNRTFPNSIGVGYTIIVLSILAGILLNMVSSRLDRKSVIFPDKIRIIKERSKYFVLSSIDSLEKTDSGVEIMDTFIEYLMCDDDEFLNSIRVMLSKGLSCKILLLNPQTKMAEQRETDLPNSSWILMEENIRRLHTFIKIHPQFTNLIEINLFDSATTYSYFKYDNEAVVSFFPSDKNSQKATNLKIRTEKNEFAKYVSQYFLDKWFASSTIRLEEYLIANLEYSSSNEQLYIGLNSLISDEVICITPVIENTRITQVLTQAHKNEQILAFKFRNEHRKFRVVKIFPPLDHTQNQTTSSPSQQFYIEKIKENYQAHPHKILPDLEKANIYQIQLEKINITCQRPSQLKLNNTNHNE
jgi:hypothetical protein